MTGSPPPNTTSTTPAANTRLAEHRLESCGIRGRRQARRDLDAAENRLTWANHTLEQVQASISPDVDRYHHAGQQVHDLRDALRSHDTAELLDRYTTNDRIPHLQERLDALDTWWRFANGDKIDVPRLAEIVDILGNVDGDHGHYRWLADAVEQHCHDAGIHLPTLEPEAPRHRNARARHRPVAAVRRRVAGAPDGLTW